MVAQLNAQPDPPTLECVNTITNANPNANCMGVNELGTAIQWLNNHGCSDADFVATHIFSSGQFDGNYISIASVTAPNQTTWVNADVTDPNVGSYYYVTHECLAGGESEPSDTIGNPNIPTIDLTKITVAGGATILEWDASTHPDAGGYIIFYEDADGNLNNLDTIFDPSITDYTHFFSTPEIKPETYSIAVIDKCSCWGIFSDNPHTTIFLETQENNCNASIELTWTPYIGWDGIQEYVVSKDLLPIATLPATANSYQYVFSPGDTNINFTVSAVYTDGSTNSVSNNANVVVNDALLPAFMKVLNATVANDVVYVQYDYDLSGSAESFALNRGTDVNALESVLSLGSNPDFLSPVADNSAQPSGFSYYYKVSAADACDTEVFSSYARTMHLTGVDNFNQTVTLNWNEFEAETANISSYVVQRINNGIETDIATLFPGDGMTYTDDLTGVEASLGFYEYRIQANFNITDSYNNNLDLESYSNVFQLAQKSRIFMPTAFRPNGVNNILTPIILYPNTDGYTFIVLNRWGEKVFESNNPTEGWDGTYKGDLAPQAVYAYVVKMKSFNGVAIEKKGTVLMIR